MKIEIRGQFVNFKIVRGQNIIFEKLGGQFIIFEKFEGSLCNYLKIYWDQIENFGKFEDQNVKFEEF